MSAMTGRGCGELFQNTSPEASMRSRIGGGGSDVGGGALVRCGRLTSIGYEAIGAVTMKMIRSTRSTSTNGVTLMSAIAPPPEFELKAIAVFSGLVGAILDRHESDLAHALGLGDVHHFANEA